MDGLIDWLGSDADVRWWAIVLLILCSKPAFRLGAWLEEQTLGRLTARRSLEPE